MYSEAQKIHVNKSDKKRQFASARVRIDQNALRKNVRTNDSLASINYNLQSGIYQQETK